MDPILVSDYIVFDQTVTTNKHIAHMSDMLILSETIDHRPKKINDHLAFNQNIIHTFHTNHYSFQDQLAFNQSVSKATLIQYNQSLVFNQDINKPKIQLINEKLYFFQVINYNQLINNRLINDTLSFSLYYDFSLISRRSMQSQIACDPVQNKTITLGSLILRSPNFGNKDDYNKTRINATSRGNEILVGGPDYWPKGRTITMDFETLSKDEITALMQLLTRTIGKPISLIDHESKSFTGIITTPSPEIKDPYGDDCTFSTSLSFLVI